MAINSQKLLPQSKFKSSLMKVEKKSTKKINESENNKSNILKKELLKIKENLIKIDKLLLSNVIFKKKEIEIGKKDKEKEKFNLRENKLEEKNEKEVTKSNESLIPKMGIFDRINRFITFTILGFLFNKFIKHLPKVLEFVKKIQPVGEFIESFVGNIFNGLVDFIDWGYKAYDSVKDFTKKIGGEPFQKTFDDFSKNLNTFVNLAIVAGMATMGGTDFGLDGKKGGKPTSRPSTPTKSKISDYLSRNDQTKKIEKLYGNDAARMYEARRSQGASQKRALGDVRKNFDHLEFQGGLKGGTKPGKVFGRGFGNAGSRFTTKILGKAGKKVAGKLLGRIPIIGGLVDFLFALWSGEPVGRAAAKGVGATIGAALGTFIPVPGVGTILGGILGDIVGGALYDTLIGNRPEKPKKSEIKAKKSGGQVATRKGKVVGGKIKRSLRRKITAPKASKIKPGASVGGEKAIKKIFPEPETNQIGKVVNPYGFITDTSNKMGEIPFLGPLFGLFGKVLLGNTPSKGDYTNIGLGMNAWINNAIMSGNLQGNLIKGFSDGGIIENAIGSNNISGWVEKSVEELVKNKVTDAINELRKNLGLEPLQESLQISPQGSEDSYESGPAGSSGDALTMARNLMRDLGLTGPQAAGIVGNMIAESGVENARPQNTPPGTKGPLVVDGVTGYGIVQWTSRGRQQKLYDFAKSMGHDMSKPLPMNIEYKFFLKEFRESYGHVLDQIKKAQDVKTASTIFMQQYEIPAGYRTQAKIMERYNSSRPIAEKLARGEGTPTRGPKESYNIQPIGKSSGWKPSRPGLFNAIEYITGDRTHSNFELSGHGLTSNYHDHIAFKSIADKEKAKRALRAQGIIIGSELRPGDKGYHGVNLAIDVPGHQWGGSGSIGSKEFAGSKKVRQILGLKDGGIIESSKKLPNTKPLEMQASYDRQEITMAIQPIIIERVVEKQSQSKISFIGRGSVNSSDDFSKSLMFVG